MPRTPAARRPVHGGSRLRHRLHPVDGALHDRIERLHAEACPRDAVPAERRNHRRRERPRVDLDRDLRIGGDGEVRGEKIDEPG